MKLRTLEIPGESEGRWAVDLTLWPWVNVEGYWQRASTDTGLPWTELFEAHRELCEELARELERVA